MLLFITFQVPMLDGHLTNSVFYQDVLINDIFAAIHPFNLLFFSNTLRYVSTKTSLLRLHSLFTCWDVNMELLNKILIIFHLSCITCVVFRFSFHLKYFRYIIWVVSGNSQLLGYLSLYRLPLQTQNLYLYFSRNFSCDFSIRKS